MKKLLKIRKLTNGPKIPRIPFKFTHNTYNTDWLDGDDEQISLCNDDCECGNGECKPENKENHDCCADKPLIGKKLKILNSKPEARKCAKCEGPLVEPYPRIKYCPKCEGD